jgi:hypothetical protein
MIAAMLLAVLAAVPVRTARVSVDERSPPQGATASATDADSSDADIAGSLAALRALDSDQALLDRMIGQMIMVGFSGSHERDEGVAAVRGQLARGEIGGVVLYPENIHRPQELRNLTAFLTKDSELTPLIGVDQEGGLVQRVSTFRRRAMSAATRSSAKRTARCIFMRAWRGSSRALAST